MINPGSLVLPTKLPQIGEKTHKLGFAMSCEHNTGVLLRALATSKRTARILELGTGTGVGTAWLLDGMDAESRLITVDVNPEYQQVARETFSNDKRLEIVTEDAASFLQRQPANSFDLVFADAMPGKFEYLDEALALVSRGGFYVVDDLLPQENWPEGHASKVERLIEKLSSLAEFRAVGLSWSSGIMILARV